MNSRYKWEISFLLVVIALSLGGFASLFVGNHEERTAYHALHIVTSLGWLGLILWQLVLLDQKKPQMHRAVGQAIFFAGPILVASLTLLTVHSALKDAEIGKADFMIVQNVMVTLEVALLILLACALRANRAIHGAFLLSSALLFMGIALFFVLISFVPGFRAMPELGAPPRFASAAQTVSMVGAAVALMFFSSSGGRVGPGCYAARSSF